MTIKTITFIGLVSAGLSEAATLVWNDAAFSDASQVDNSPGTLLFARNLGSNTAVSVNGVNFTGQTAGSISAIPNFRWGLTDSASANAGGLYGAAKGVAGLAAGQEVTLLDNIVYGGNGNSFEFQDLVVGDTYIAQIILVDNRAPFAGRNMHVSQDASTWAGALVDYTSNSSAPGPQNWARIVTTTFVADGTTQAFRYGIQGSGSPEASAIQLRAIPEPSSAVMVAMGAMALLLRRRK